MELNLEKNVITLYGKSYKYDLLLNKLTNLTGEDIYHFISNRGIALPRKMNCMAMISVLNERIKYLHSKSLSKDYFARIEHYKDFGETQLSELFKKICNEEDFYNYRFNLLNLILINYEALSLNDGEIQYLRNVKKSKVESFSDYENYISACCLEQEGTFDGVEIEILKSSLLVSSSSEDIIKLGNKYGIEIPEHLTKEEYYDFIVYYLKKKDKYTDEVEQEIQEMTLAGLSTFARRNGIPLQPTLNKEDYITYLFYYLEGCDIVTTNVSEIIADDRYEALEYKVDLSQINVFGEGEAKRLISFTGDDDPEYVKKIDEIIEVYNKPKEENPLESLSAPIRPGEKTMDDDSGEIELEDFEIELQEIEEKKEEETKEDEVVLEEIPIEIDEEKTQEEAEPFVEKIDISNVKKNDEYASKKLKNLKHGNRNVIILSVVISFLVVVLGFVIYALVR